MSERLSSGVSDPPDYSGYGSYTAYDPSYSPDSPDAAADAYGHAAAATVTAAPPAGAGWDGHDAYGGGYDGWAAGADGPAGTWDAAPHDPAWGAAAGGTWGGADGGYAAGYTAEPAPTDEYGGAYGGWAAGEDAAAYGTGYVPEYAAAPDEPPYAPEGGTAAGDDAPPAGEAADDAGDADAGCDDAPAPADVAAPPRPAGRGRRRCARPARARSAFLSVAAPSLAVLGVTAVATAATVSETGGGTGSPAPVAAPDPAGDAAAVEDVAANAELDTRLASLSAAADDYAERASRTQGRLDLEAQREQEQQEAAAEAARLEAMRPKFSLPVAQHGLSAYYGQAGVNWMSQHTGIDFPVAYGTPVMAATDGTITTQWHPSYGNMVVLTAEDGTETWYAHLDSALYTSGWVQAGTVIAYSGNSGNSTGPHLHFEVHPGGGPAVDPLAWLRGHGLEPT